MDKNSIKKYATWARRELISRVSQKAEQYGVRQDDFGDPNAKSIGDTLLTAEEQTQRRALIEKLRDKGWEWTMEEAAYT